MVHLGGRFAEPRSVYVHVPFCLHRCGYCDFSLLTGRDDLVPKYFSALERELFQSSACHDIDTLYIGGGTPTRLGASGLRTLVRLIRRHFQLSSGHEFTIEANPNDISESLVECLLEAGVNRISLGIQSFSDHKLRSLDRRHTQADNLRAIQLLRPISNVSFDLIFAAPQDSMSDWQTEIERLVERQPAHVSTYGLTYEKGTAFFAALKAGKLDEIDEEVQRSMYEFAIDRLTLAGYEQYEVSSFAKPGFRSRHNQVYWRGLPFYGFGPGAASYFQGVRRVNHRSPITYMERMLRGESPVDQCDLVNDEAHARDCLVFGLRMREGLDERVFQQDTGFDIYQLGGNALTRFLAQGWMQRKEGRLLLTRSGLLISDSLWPELIVG